MNWLYIVILIAVLLVIILILFFAFRKFRVKKLKNQAEELERQRNLIVSTPIGSELSKIDVVMRNDKLEAKFKDWQDRYEDIKTKRFAEVTDMLLNVDNLIEDHKYKEAEEALIELDMEIYKIRTTTDNLLNEIREVTMSEERNRAIVIKLKAKFRELERTLNSNQPAYGDIYKFIELQLENIEKKFQEFEECMDANEYESIVTLVKVLDEMISHMDTVIDEMPDIILLINKIIPSRIKEVRDTYDKLLEKNFPLDYLKVPYNLEQIEKKLKDINDKVKMLNLEDSLFDLKTFLDYLDNLLNDFDVEKRSKKIFDEEANEFKKKMLKVNKIVTDIYGQIEDIKTMYNLTESDLGELEAVNKNLYSANQEYNELIKCIKDKSKAYSELKVIIEGLSVKFANIEEELNNCIKSLGSMQDDEARAREQLDEITELLKKCRNKIKSYSLPIISNNYFVELAEADEAMNDIIKELEKVPITIKTLNIRVDNARDLSLKLYNTTNEMIKTARLSEMTIVYGNRYKPTDKDIATGLDEASQMFFKGNYTKSLETAINAIKIIEPDIYNKILGIYKENM